MTDIEKNVNEEEFEEIPVFTLTDEESGESQDFELLASATIDGTLYYALVPADEEESEEDHLRFLAERSEESLCKNDVESDLGCGDCKHESTEEEHDHRIGESGHDRLIVNICAGTVIHHEAETLV